ncbi:MAG TPA: hypothetical protein EYN07_00640 [Flavobacteriaceae bacterium]|jgi:hypothetical protein|nr:hypothetical protein [Flavobacteriaceae bacterium]HIB49556.1 hypothetical protein [Flavobacteriaceae bacterium]HIN97722.1 hypothetical protein [Flavobacteriaceae bacterium]|tara:strand:- start:162 stop:677 length:516 start_codon:yes stop_codon:yes gene_type:complete
MKRIKQFCLILLVGLAVTACKKDDDGGEDPAAGTGTLTASIDGAGLTADIAVQAQITMSAQGDVLAISGGTSQSENLQMIIQNFDGAGTYELNFLNIGTYSYLPDPSNPDPSTVVIYTTVNGTQSEGELRVSSFDGNTIVGTFNFTGYNANDMSDTVAVTAGEFNLEVTNN